MPKSLSGRRPSLYVSNLNSIPSRAALAQKIAKQLFSTQEAIVLYGRAGVGKTELLDAIYHEVKSICDTGDALVIYQAEAEYASSALQLVEHIFQLLTTYIVAKGRLFRIREWIQRFRRGLNESPGQHMIKLASSGALSLVDPTAVSTALLGKSALDIVKNAEVTASKEPSRKTNDIDNDFDWYFSKITKMASTLSDLRFIIVLEHAENLDYKAFDSVIRFINNGYKNIKLVFVCTSDVRWYSENKGISRLFSKLPRGCLHEVEPLDLEGLRHWKTIETGLSVANDVLNDALSKSHGLPCVLQQWVRSTETERMANIDMSSLPISNYQDRMGQLSHSESLTLHYLASVDMNAGISSSLLANATGIDQASLNTSLSRLMQLELVEHRNGSYAVKGNELRGYISDQLTSNDLNVYRNNLLDKIRYKSEPGFFEPTHLVGLVAGLINESMGEAALQQLLDIATYLTGAGQYLLAQDTLNKITEIDKSIDDSSESIKSVRWSAGVCRGEIFNQLGKYQEAIEILKALHNEGCRSLDLHLNLGESYLRLNQYKIARKHYAFAAEKAKELNRTDILVRAQIRRVTICIDLEEFGLAKQIISLYDDEVHGNQISSSTRCHLYRWKARVSITSGNDEGYKSAKLAAEKALEIAQGLNVRQRGNSSFVVGYIHMHGLNFSDAERYLCDSLKIAVELGNKDLEIYDLIVLTLNSLKAGGISEARHWFGKLVAAMNYDAPLEELYKFLLEELLRSESQNVNADRCRSIAHKFENLGRGTAANLSRILAQTPEIASQNLLLSNRLYL